MASIEVVVLAAGLGTRMKSNIPKVLHKVCGVSMLEHVLRKIQRASELTTISFESINIVIGHERQMVKDEVTQIQKNAKVKIPIQFSIQDQQLGTGHALRCALDQSTKKSSLLLVLNGDLPLMHGQTLVNFIMDHIQTKSTASLCSTELNDSTGYGRIVRSGKTFKKVIEQKDASAKELKIKEVNGGVYLFDRSFVEKMRFNNKNAQKEFYITDVFVESVKKKKKITAYKVQDSNQLRGVNTLSELASVQKFKYLETATKWMNSGVTIHDPEHTYIGLDVYFEKTAEVYPNTIISGECFFADKVKIGLNCELNNVKVNENTYIKNSVVAENSEIGSNCTVGPMAYLRSGTKLSDNVRIGNFVETKESSIGEHTNAAHLSYIGDAEIGKNVNLGCGFITCNFDGTIKDGRRKHRTKIGNNVFIGSDSQVVAPISIADGTYIASGSTVTDSTDTPDTLVIARTRQVTKPGYAKKYRK